MQSPASCGYGKEGDRFGEPRTTVMWNQFAAVRKFAQAITLTPLPCSGLGAGVLAGTAGDGDGTS